MCRSSHHSNTNYFPLKLLSSLPDSSSGQNSLLSLRQPFLDDASSHSPIQPLVSLLRNTGAGWILEERGGSWWSNPNMPFLPGFKFSSWAPKFSSWAASFVTHSPFTQQPVKLESIKKTNHFVSYDISNQIHCNASAGNRETSTEEKGIAHFFVASGFAWLKDWFLHQLCSLPGVPPHQRLWRRRNKGAAILDKASQGP